MEQGVPPPRCREENEIAESGGKERRDLRRQIERGSHEAKLHYEDHPTDAAALAAWLDSHQLLQALHSPAAKTAGLQAGILWDQYGEQSTFCFIPLAGERQLKTTINHILPQGAEQAIPLDTPASVQTARDTL
jgi:hypothetical protein